MSSYLTKEEAVIIELKKMIMFEQTKGYVFGFMTALLAWWIWW